MSTRTQIVTTSTNADSTLAAATVIAENLRNAGATVTIGDPYVEQENNRKAGLASVALTIEEPDEQQPESVSAEEPVAPAEGTPPVEPAQTEVPTVTEPPAPEPEPASATPTETEETPADEPGEDESIMPEPGEPQSTETPVEEPAPTEETA